MNSGIFLLAIAFSLSLAACGKEEPEAGTAPPEAVQPPVAAEAQQEQVPDAAGTEVPQSGYDIYVAKCINCHGDVGQGVEGNPKLSGLTRADVGARLTDYRGGKSLGPKTEVMTMAARDLTDGQIAALASYVGE